MNRHCLLLLVGLLAPLCAVEAQPTFYPNLPSAVDLQLYYAERLFGDPNIQILSWDGSGPGVQMGLFFGLNGWDPGVVLSTGDIRDQAGPNSFTSMAWGIYDADSDLGGEGYARLEPLMENAPSRDAAWLSVDLVPQRDLWFSMRVAYATEEWNLGLMRAVIEPSAVWVNGVLLRKMDMFDLVGSNPEFLPNYGGELSANALLGLDLGQPILAEMMLEAGQTYRFEMAIADHGDGRVDSALYLEPATYQVVPEGRAFGLAGALALLTVISLRRLRS